MKAKLTQWIIVAAVVGGCSTTQLAPIEPPPVQPPPYVQVPHPTGLDIGDIRAIMLQPKAPTRESMQGCEADFQKLRSLTQSEDERKQGARELVKLDPVKYHWCFYTKVLDLEDTLRTSTFIDEKQKVALESYQFLVPIARGFLDEFKDSRYQRWAIQHYRRVSEWVFFKRVDLSPEGTSQLVQVSNPFGLWRDPKPEVTTLEKYGIVKPKDDAVAGSEAKNIFPAPAPVADREPAAEASPAPPAPETLPAIEGPAAPLPESK